jgi:hypothetical protein
VSSELENKLSEFGWSATADKDEMKNKLKTFGLEDVLIYRVDKLHRIDCITKLYFMETHKDDLDITDNRNAQCPAYGWLDE